jgi:ribose transport system substrate-binding protein
MKKLIIKLLIACMVIGTMYSNGFAAEKKNFSFVVKDMTNPYYWRMRAGAEQAAKDLGVNFSWIAAQFNGDIQGQIGIVETQLAMGPDALILVPMNASALVPKVKEANSLGIPVINPDTRLAGGDVVSFVGLDERSSAIQMAKFIVKHFNGKVKLAILEGFRGSSTAEERLNGFREIFDAEPGVKVLASQTAEWDREKGLKVTEDILQAHPDVQLIVASNDEMALGAIQAIRSAGKTNQVFVTGDDAIPAGLQALKDGKMLATIDGNTDKVGYRAVQVAYDYVVKVKRNISKWTKVSSSVMVKSDISDEYLKSRKISLK